jgi:exosortase A-associated hydrolase 1
MIQERIVNLSLPGGAAGFGILSTPPAQAASIGVLIVVGGPQYRVGSHRHFVQLARTLAEAGFACLRFDHSGMGDSPGPVPNFEALDDDIAAALDTFMREQSHLEGVVLWGLCDGASAALLYAARRQDPRVRGLALLNPWVRSAQSEARAQVSHYYGQRLRSMAFWRKLLQGGVGWPQLRNWWRTYRRAQSSAPVAAKLPFPAVMAQGWSRFQGPILLQIASPDLTAQEFLDTATQSWPDWRNKPQLTRLDHASASHTFPAIADKRLVNQQLLDWLRDAFGVSPSKS